MGRQTLGGNTFQFDPDETDIPDKKKSVARTKTYTGSVIFEWAAVAEGTFVELRWDWMYDGQYKMLRRLYLQIGKTFTWTLPNGAEYEVAIVGLQGAYFKHFGPDSSYRRQVRLALDIRSVLVLPTTTTTTSTTTTTTNTATTTTTT